MFNNQKINFPKNKGAILTIFLLFCVASSKGIIIYNEETLVALSFGLFVIFCYSYFGNTIKESLDERTFTIQSGLENFHRLKEESLQKLLSFHKRSLELKKAFPSLKKDNENLISHTTLSSLVYTTRFVNKKGKNEKAQTASPKAIKWEKKRFPGSSIELYNNFCEKIIQKLVVFKSSKASLHQRLQNSIALHLKESVLCKIKKIKQDKSSNLVSKQVKQGLKLLAVK